jgi:hypothetical protein
MFNLRALQRPVMPPNAKCRMPITLSALVHTPTALRTHALRRGVLDTTVKSLEKVCQCDDCGSVVCPMIPTVRLRGRPSWAKLDGCL